MACEECRKRREAMIAKVREFAYRVQHPFEQPVSLTAEQKQKQQENKTKNS